MCGTAHLLEFGHAPQTLPLPGFVLTLARRNAMDSIVILYVGDQRYRI